MVGDQDLDGKMMEIRVGIAMASSWKPTVGDVVLTVRKRGEGTDEALGAVDHDSAIVKEVRPSDLDAIDQDLEGNGGGVLDPRWEAMEVMVRQRPGLVVLS